MGEPFHAVRDGVVLSGEEAGAGPAVVLLHGLSATRRYVVHGSKALERSGLRVIAYDARGHGESSPAPGYSYDSMVGDLVAVLDERGVERAALVGNSMGAAVAAALALERPGRVAALVQVTPAFRGEPKVDPADLAEWDALAEGLEEGGAEGFLAAYRPDVDDRFHETVMRFTRQRLERHRHPGSVAAALREVPRSTAFAPLERLREIEAPALVVGSRDASDPGHPLEVAEAYAELIPDAELMVEEPGASPLAWQGAQLSRRIATFLRTTGYS